MTRRRGAEALEAGLVAGFRAAFGRPAEVLSFAPGRVNLIGEHTDYNDGWVLPCALAQGTMVAGARRADDRIVVRALDFGEARDEFAVRGPIEPLTPGHWANHPRGLVAAWRARGHDLPGLDLAVSGDLPRGAGLSSSASLGVALAAAFAQLAGVPPGPVDWARLAQTAEHDLVGCACGIMDPLVAAAAEEGSALLIDCRSLERRPVALPDRAVVLVVHSGVSRGLAEGAYNTRRAECARAARAFGVSSLRDLGPAAVSTAPRGLDATMLRRAKHVVSENARVHDFVAALRGGDLAAAGVALRASHDSLRADFEVSHPAVDALVAVLDRAIGVAGGARMTGGGFGGCVVAVMEPERLGPARAAAIDHLRARGIAEPLVSTVRPAAGASAWVAAHA